MSKIITVTINPALDKNSTTNKVEQDEKLRCDYPDFEPGGGGINISRAIHQLGGDSITVFPSGGPSGTAIEDLLKEQEIAYESIPIHNWTRENLNVFEKETGKQYRFVMPGADVSEKEMEHLERTIKELGDFDILILSGSLPENTSDKIYADLSKIAEEKNAKCIIDTSGVPLKHALESGHIYMAKPNISELSFLTGKKIETAHDLEDITKSIIQEGHVDVLAVSLGPQGALLVTKDFCEQIIPPTVRKLSTVGAGDSMVAGITLMLSKGKDIREAVRYGIAAGTAAIMNEGSELCKKEDADHIFKWVMEKYPL